MDERSNQQRTGLHRIGQHLGVIAPHCAEEGGGSQQDVNGVTEAVEWPHVIPRSHLVDEQPKFILVDLADGRRELWVAGEGKEGELREELAAVGGKAKLSWNQIEVGGKGEIEAKAIDDKAADAGAKKSENEPQAIEDGDSGTKSNEKDGGGG